MEAGFSWFTLECTAEGEESGYRGQRVLEVKSLWKDGWRFVADVNELSSMTFRLAFTDTYGDAIQSEIRSAVFLTYNFKGFSFNVAGLNDRSFLQLISANSVVLGSAPEIRFS